MTNLVTTKPYSSKHYVYIHLHRSCHLVKPWRIAHYKISKGTRLLVNLWKVHRDPHVWSEPNEFRQERFLTSHKELDVRGQHFELIPFGSGRRVCPGISLALQIVQLVLAHLIHGFEVR
ncbi:LOW QUALITY PROTEIN: hypothetical protein RJ639_029630 [Escallonia herrerae]|uniref:Cytochrome P450 n=1 Tax=Escallonia herrerae TaxID=1293975 RepID=A0AA89BNL2_9ASTE|nr:LOW QUALITY PROTEIN: hypothetical protein RJ639_029630 [Escallonia herrerae]